MYYNFVSDNVSSLLKLCNEVVLHTPFFSDFLQSTFMSLLSEYLRVLVPEEKERIRAINLTMREREVLTILLEYNENTQEKQRISYGISSGNWDKLQSVLLRKCYDAIVPQGGEKLIQHLSTRYTLSKHIRKEVAHQRKILLPTLNTQQQYLYFQSLFHTFLHIPLAVFNR